MVRRMDAPDEDEDVLAFIEKRQTTHITEDEGLTAIEDLERLKKNFDTWHRICRA